MITRFSILREKLFHFGPCPNCQIDRKSTNDDNDDSNDNYDSNDGNYHDNDDKNDQKTYKYYDFSAKMYQFKGLLLGKKKGQRFGHR